MQGVGISPVWAIQEGLFCTGEIDWLGGGFWAGQGEVSKRKWEKREQGRNAWALAAAAGAAGWQSLMGQQRASADLSHAMQHCCKHGHWLPLLWRVLQPAAHRRAVCALTA
jgi:hypothetical protein